MKFTKVPIDLLETLQMNAGVLVDSFVPATGTLGNILGATTGGLTFATNPNFVDFGEDVDNCPPNTWQMKRITYYDPAISGTFLTTGAASIKRQIGAADIDSQDSTHIVPRHELKEADFSDVWAVGDFSNVNTGASAGFLAIHLMNVLNTTGLQWSSTKDGKGQFSFDFHGHYDYDDVDTVPFEIYIAAGEEETAETTETTETT